MVKYYYHRLLRLFTCIDNSALVTLLLGPFARFYHENGFSQCSSASQAFATELATHDIQRAALCKMHEIWLLYEKHKTRLDKKASFPYFVGVVMDTHLPVATLTDKVSISDVYLRKLAPEQITLQNIWCDEGFPNKYAILEQLWSSQFGSSMVIAVNTPSQPPSKKKAKTKASQSETLLYQQNLPKDVHLCSADEKLLRKG